MSNYLLISDAAKEVRVESHVLRYWEEELHLPIKRNEMGHRYYTQDDVERFKQIKTMKEGGLQLKAIKMLLWDGKLDVLQQEVVPENAEPHMSIHIIESRNEEKVSTAANQNIGQMIAPSNQSSEQTLATESKEDKSRRLQWILQQLIRETLQENNQQLCQDIKESVIKELDYQFRVQEEREEERDRRQDQRNEEYYKKMDELLRKKSKGAIARAERTQKRERAEQEKLERKEKQEQEKQERKEKLEQEKQERKEKQERDKADKEKLKQLEKGKHKTNPSGAKSAAKENASEVSKGKIMDIQSVEKKAKRKRHFIF